MQKGAATESEEIPAKPVQYRHSDRQYTLPCRFSGPNIYPFVRSSEPSLRPDLPSGSANERTGGEEVMEGGRAAANACAFTDVAKLARTSLRMRATRP